MRKNKDFNTLYPHNYKIEILLSLVYDKKVKEWHYEKEKKINTYGTNCSFYICYYGHIIDRIIIN